MENKEEEKNACETMNAEWRIHQFRLFFGVQPEMKRSVANVYPLWPYYRLQNYRRGN